MEKKKVKKMVYGEGKPLLNKPFDELTREERLELAENVYLTAVAWFYSDCPEPEQTIQQALKRVRKEKLAEKLHNQIVDACFRVADEGEYENSFLRNYWNLILDDDLEPENDEEWRLMNDSKYVKFIALVFSEALEFIFHAARQQAYDKIPGIPKSLHDNFIGAVIEEFIMENFPYIVKFVMERLVEDDYQFWPWMFEEAGETDDESEFEEFEEFEYPLTESF